MNLDYSTHGTSSPFSADTRYFYLRVSREGVEWYCGTLPKDLDLKIKAAFLNPEGKLVVIDVNNSDGCAFKLVTAFAPTGAGQSGYFKRLCVFLGMSRFLVLVGDWNAVLDVSIAWEYLIREGVQKPHQPAQTCPVV